MVGVSVTGRRSSCRLARGGDGLAALDRYRSDEDGGRRDATRLLADASFILQRVVDVTPEPALVDGGL
jgi:hypothetical protein